MIGRILLALCLFSAPAFADDINSAADKAISADEIALQDGRVVRLAGIKSLSNDARDFLQTHTAGHNITLQNTVTDRYGRLSAIVTVQGDSESLEEILLQAGLAFVYPADGDADDAWLADESAARRAQIGAWPQHADVSSDDAGKLYGSYGFVSGVVNKAERVKNKFYLNFGDDWRTDFTIAIAAHDLRKFKNADMDLNVLAGKKIRVRGWVKQDFGPMITVSDPQQIEIVN